MTQLLNVTISAAGTYFGLPFMSADPKQQRLWPLNQNIEAVFNYGSGGTSVDVYVQTTHDGATWRDTCHFAQMTTSTVRDIWRASSADSVLDPDQQVPAPHLSWWRARYVVAGTYAGNTTLQINVIGADLVRANVAP